MTQVLEDENRLVVIRSHLNAPDGRLMRSLLDARGIHAFLSGENVAGMNEGMFANLMVRAGNREEAEHILSNVRALPASAFPVRQDPDGEELACHRCGSSRVHPFVGRLPSSVPFLRQTVSQKDAFYHCLECGSYYTEKRPRFSSLTIAVMWGGTLALITLLIIWVINWLQWS
ncbi:hypothetical protein [Kordiimonas aestuarii]|uniref:hypothetical protein n=1 Tax=Kordiimonas aestuarii TaxID=1005925 RepID=UPI0021CF12AF|nr:hypothetical protein [Kordiimonas aestuarii]